jgi:hypothetical protein
MKNFNGLSEEKVDELILNYLTTNKFQSSLNSLIISTLSQKKNMSLDRDGLSNQIISHQYIKDVENEILQNLFEAFDIENYDTNELINLKYKSIIGSNQNTLNNQSLLNPNSPLNSVNSTINNNITNMKLLSVLLEDLKTCPFKPENYLKIESYIGDLSNFDVELLLNCGKIDEILEKVNQFIKLGCSKDLFLNSNLINFFNKLSLGSNTVVLCKSINIFLDYFSGIVSKFYESSFDITKFYKLSYNVECLNKLVMKFYENPDVHLRKIDEKLVKSIVDKIFEAIMKNYSPNNPVYISDYSPDDDDSKESSSEFGLSTNYILLLFFILDRHFSVFKVLFRISTLRKYILPKFEGNNMIKTLPFLDMVSCIASLNKKFCFLWYHSSVLEKLYSAKKINKKFLLYCWISIKLNFLGLILRYKSLRNKFYETIKEVDASLNCFLHFRNVLALTVDLVLESNKDFEDYQRDNLFYLTKEILCDFILYCDDRDCCEKKYYLIKEINAKDSLKKNKMIKYLIEDLKLALNENIYTHDVSQDKDKEKSEDIKENVEDEEKAKINISNISKNQTVSSHNINPINIEKK